MEANKVTSSHKPPSDGGMAKEEFIRVGTTLYKIVEQPRLSGGYVKKRIPWNNETLRQDYGKDYIGSVPKYDGFCTVPEHIGYRPVIGKFLNLYEPIDHQPQEGDFPSIRSLVEHIFGEQYELGMDYLQLLYLQPVQKLPILLLVSEERNTGKSTFLNFLSQALSIMSPTGVPEDNGFLSFSNPVAITVTKISSSKLSSITAPKIIFASGSTLR